MPTNHVLTQHNKIQMQSIYRLIFKCPDNCVIKSSGIELHIYDFVYTYVYLYITDISSWYINIF